MRLFIAVNPPETVRDALARVTEPLRLAQHPVKWVAPESVHLTLKFLGNVAAERESDVGAAIEAACTGVRAFPLPVGGFGAFPNLQRPRVIWLGCESVPALELLQHGIERATAPLGFAVDGRPFRPHLTLGRVRGGRRLAGFAELIEALTFADEFLVESIDLMQSTLTRGGARYETRRRVMLLPA